MTSENNDVDDLDFSDLDLETTPDYEESTPAKKGIDVATLGIYGLIGLAVIGVVVWQTGILGGGNTLPPASEEIVSTAPAVDPSQQPSDPFNVMGTTTEATPDMQMDTATTPVTGTEAAGAPAMAADGTLVAATPTTIDPVAPATVASETLPPAAGEGAVTSVMSAQEANADSAIPMPLKTSLEAAPATAISQNDTAMPTTPPVADNATTPVVNAPVTLPEATVSVASPSVPTPPSETNAGVTVNAADMTTILNRLEAIEKRLDSQNTSTSPALTSEIQDLKATVARLESGSKTSVDDTPMVTEKVEQPAPKKKTTKKKTSSKKSSSTKASDAPYSGGAIIEKKSSSPSNNYTLRAAQQDAAWISGADGDLREVRIGDSLPGIGEVKAISKDQNGWSIVGSQGRISQ